MVLNCTDMFAFQCTANQIHCKITKEDINKFAHFTQCLIHVSFWGNIFFPKKVFPNYTPVHNTYNGIIAIP